jgi:peroxiredoxin
MRRIILRVLSYLVVGAVCFVTGAWTRDYLVKREAQEARARPSKFLGKIVPAIQSATISGEAWTLQSARGKVVVLEFWSAACAPCVSAVPRLKAHEARFGSRGDYMMVGVSLDKAESAARDFCLRHDIQWTQLFESGKEFGNSVARALEIDRIPFVCVIDKVGVVRYYNGIVGRNDPRELDVLVQKLLNEG